MYFFATAYQLKRAILIMATEILWLVSFMVLFVTINTNKSIFSLHPGLSLWMELKNRARSGVYAKRLVTVILSLKTNPGARWICRDV